MDEPMLADLSSERSMDSDSESDEESQLPLPRVQRFEPTPLHAGGGNSTSSHSPFRFGGAHENPSSSAFPGISESQSWGDWDSSGQPRAKTRGSQATGGAAQAVGLRSGWNRMPSSEDQLY